MQPLYNQPQDFLGVREYVDNSSADSFPGGEKARAESPMDTFPRLPLADRLG